MTGGAQVVVRTDRFDDDLAALTDRHGFRVESIFPADAPDTAVVSGHGVMLRLEAAAESRPVTLRLPGDPGGESRYVLPGGSRIEVCAPPGDALPPNVAELTITHADDTAAPGRAGMLYRDLLPDRWGGRFIASLITIPDGGPVPDYVHYHRVRFQMIFVKAGWVRVVYEDQGDPFVMRTGDCVLQPPQIRHRVLAASPGLEVIEVGCPARHETLADWDLALPNGSGDPGRTWDGSRFVRHVAADASHQPWRVPGWECRDTGIGAATAGLAGVRVARPVRPEPHTLAPDTEFALLVVLAGEVGLQVADGPVERLRPGSAAAVPGGLAHRLVDPSTDCEVLDVTLPADP